jgi:hypothetical protein
MPNNQTIKSIIILGMHRSGTSMVAGVLARLGVNMGRELMPPNRGNPTGYYENMDFVKLNREILGHQDNSVLPIPSSQEIINKKDKFGEQIKKIIKKSQSSLWGWKDPRTCLTIELFLPFLTNPYFIICQRNPLAIARSLKKRDGLSVEMGIKINEIYNQRITNFFQRNPELKRMFISYEKMVAEPEQAVRGIIQFIDLKSNPKDFNQAVKFILSPWGKKKAKWSYYFHRLISIWFFL